MVLRNGKFYDEAGNVVPLEHGNKEQFKLMEEERHRINSFSEDGYAVTMDVGEVTTYDLSIRFKCICGSWLLRDGETDDSMDISSILKRTFVCNECKRSYFAEPDPDGFDVCDLVIKLKK